MINRIIAEYIKGHKRLVVPGFGAFIRKDSGEVVLIEFLKKNDGVLISLIAQSRGVSEEEALEAVEQYIAKIKRNIAQSGNYHIENLGKIYVTSNGFYELEYLAIDEGENPEDIFDSKAAQYQPQEVREAAVPKPSEAGPAAQPYTPTPAVRPESQIRPQTVEPVMAQANNPVRPQPENPVRTQTANPVRPQTENFARPQAVNQTRPQAGNPVRPQMREQPGIQVIDPARTYSKPAQPVRPAHSAPSYQPQEKKTDMVMVVAIAAAVIALIAIFFALMANGSPAKQMVPVNNPVEQVSEAPEGNL